MKELTIEEKTKAYEEALERAKSAIKECGDNVGRIKMIESIFPELRESEEEKVRKQIINHLDFLARGAKDMGNSPEFSKYTSWIAYLEKLKDFDKKLEEAYENPSQDFMAGAEWADKTMLKKACKWLEENAGSYLLYPMTKGHCWKIFVKL